MVIIKHLSEYDLPPNFTGKTYDYVSLIFRKNKLIHRYYGPCEIRFTGNKTWWFNGKFYGSSYDKYNQKQFFKDLSKQWLL